MATFVTLFSFVCVLAAVAFSHLGNGTDNFYIDSSQDYDYR